MSIKTELLMIQEANEGILRPDAVVEWAEKHPTSDLHESFEWDDEKAGHAYRLWQARQLISITITNEVGERQTFALRIDRKNGGGYRSLDDIMQAPNLREALLSQALADLERVRVKYATIKELARVWSALDEAQEKAAKKSKTKKQKGRQSNRRYREDRPSA